MIGTEAGKLSKIKKKVYFSLAWAGLLLLLCACTAINEENSIYPSADRQGLEILDTCPKKDQQDISTEAVVKILFNNALNPKSVDLNSVLLGNGRSLVAGNVYYDERLVTYIPIESLESDTIYNLYITNALRDENGFALTKDVYSFSFRTGSDGGVTCRE